MNALQRFADMIETILSMDDSPALNELTDLVRKYMNAPPFRRAMYDARIAVMTRFAPIASAGRMRQLANVGLAYDNESNAMTTTDQNIVDAYVKGRSGQKRIDAAFRLLLHLNQAERFGKVAALAREMLSRIDKVPDPFKRLNLTLGLGGSLVKDTHIDALVASQSWADIKPIPATYDVPPTEDEDEVQPQEDESPISEPADETAQELADRVVENERRARVRRDRESENARRAEVKTKRLFHIAEQKESWEMEIADVEAKAAAPDSSADLDAAAATETDPERKLYLLRKAHEASLTE